MKTGMRAGVHTLTRVLLLGALIASGGAAHAAAVAVGTPLPEFSLKDSTGADHKLGDYKGKVLVLVFDSPTCPFSNGADPTLNALAEKYRDKGVAFLGVDANAGVTPEDLNKHIATAKVPYPILKDPDNTYADVLGAKVTPELFIVDKDGKLAYHGAPDNRTGPNSEATEHYAADALAALTAGKPVSNKEVQAWGCGIRRVKKS